MCVGRFGSRGLRSTCAFPTGKYRQQPKMLCTGDNTKHNVYNALHIRHLRGVKMIILSRLPTMSVMYNQIHKQYDKFAYYYYYYLSTCWA